MARASQKSEESGRERAHARFVRHDQEQGVFFVSEGNPAVRATTYLTTGKKRVDFSIPRGLSGTQAVEVRTRRKEMGTVLSSELLGPLEPAV